ncbi:MAG: hypothetical protein ACT4OK_22010 [Gemmobacter sp.]
MRDAHHTLQIYLDEVAAAVMRQDYAAYRERVALPFQLVTHTASLHIDTDAVLRQGFDTFAQSLQMQKITDFLRLVEGAEQMDEALITGRYVTHMMAGAHRVIPPFRSQITLRHEDGRWRAASITNALANSRWPLILPIVAQDADAKGPQT